MTYEEAKQKLEEAIGAPIVEIHEWIDYYSYEDSKKGKSNVRTGNSSYCLPRFRKRSEPLPTLRSNFPLFAKIQSIFSKSKRWGVE